MHIKGRMLDAMVEGVVLWHFAFPAIFTTEELIEKAKADFESTYRFGHTHEDLNISILRLNETGFLDKVSPTKWRLSKEPYKSGFFYS